MPLLQKLKFKQKLLSSAVESISTKELLNRLQKLSTELSTADQDKINIASFDAVKDQLFNKKLLKHTNQGVQAFTCCCCADILRLYAPDAPFTAPQLSDIFKTIFLQLRRLEDAENPYYQQQVYLLKSLAEVRSVVLITDLPDAESLVEKVFTTLYELASANFPAKLEPLAADILSEIISESETIPHKVLTLVLNKFLSSETSLSNVSNPGFKFTLAICNMNMDRMARQIAQYFSEIMYENTNLEEISDAQTIAQLGKIHDLSLAIWKHVPELLGSVMGLIDDELLAENEKIRVLATQTLGQIIGHSPSRVNFTTEHSETWLNWMKKTLDVSPRVRAEWVKQAANMVLMVSTSHLPEEIVHGISKCLLDSDERVRFAACRAIARVPSAKLVATVLATDKTLLKTLAQLIRERHPEIRTTVVQVLATLYDDCFPKLFQGDESLDALVGWIPEQILNLIYINDRNINSLVDMAVFEKLLPTDANAETRVARQLQVMRHLEPKAKQAFMAISKRQQQLAGVLTKLVEFSESYNGGAETAEEDNVKTLQQIDTVNRWLCASLPENGNAYETLDLFVRLNNRRWYKLIRLAISSESDYDTIASSMKELFAKMSEIKGKKGGADMLSTFKLLLYRASVVLYNKSNISSVVAMSKARGSFQEAADEWLEQASVTNPSVFKSHVQTLYGLVLTETSVAKSLKTVFRYCKKFLEQPPREVTDKLLSLAISGTPQEAKYSIKILGLHSDTKPLIQDVFDLIYPLNAKSPKFVTHLSSVVQMFLESPLVLVYDAEELTSFLIKNILLTNTRGAVDSDPEWISDEALETGSEPELSAKLYTLRCFVNRLKSLETSSHGSVSGPVFKLFSTLIGSGGEIVNQKTGLPTPKHYQSRLRLAAGLLLLKLAKLPVYSNMVNPQTVNRLTFVVQDQSENVRREFITKAKKYLASEVVSEKFLPLIFFMAHEPNTEVRDDVQTWVRSFSTRCARSKDVKFERTLVRLIHMIAHNQEFADLVSVEATLLKGFSYALEYIAFYINCIATQQNISFLFYLASRVKQYRDNTIDESLYDQAVAPESVLNLYRVAEVAQMVVKELHDAKNWTLETYPARIQLTADLFAPMKSVEETKRIVSTVFVPETAQAELAKLIRHKLQLAPKRKAAPRVKPAVNPGTPKAKSTPVKRTKSPKSKVAKKAKVAINPEDLRKSSRSRNNVSYTVSDSEEEETSDFE
ncbi:hypothetical protein BABINDRAFT_6525 [Babjeviella inositovora NRRL Y-12698]|uniref:Sister chromatid cohesion protein PDS5 n=1 Tax=Babjeviella inositovora NRRL Y-12698 TaxID=984486 RepID=A0A1E3QW48_9ASCO|nr:uncharacterized protein BABINDRAFT_6525 [Babjeviella inositovora NRRL Y-12698]ODQ81888.1 hypothetical protein BABINDRAFT_6525 [Babjeviella inositovora NRRL Y-12698]